MLSGLRPLARLVIRRLFEVRIHGADNVPTHGPVIFAANHIGVADGPVLAIFGPRPVHALRDGGAVGIFPEGRRGGGELERFHRGAAYFGLASGAPIVPVIFLGTREPGGHTESLPARRGTVDMLFGTPYALPATPWPRTREQVGYASALLREHLLTTLDHALAVTGRELPGPLPADEVEPDPATGVTDQGAP